MSVSREFLKIVDKPSFLEYMDFLKHNHAKECQDKLQISFVQLAREDILKYKICEQEFFYNIKENAVFLADEELLELKELVSFERTNRSSLKQFLKAAEKIKDTNCQVVKVEGEYGICVRTLMEKKYIKQTFFQFSAAGLRKWYKEREAELKHKKIEYAKSLQSYGNLLAGDIYDLVCRNSFITEEAIVRNLRGMKQTLTIKDVEHSGRYGLLTNDEVESYDRSFFYLIKPCPEGELLSEVVLEEGKNISTFRDIDWVSYMKKAVENGKELRAGRTEQMRLLEQKRVLCIYPDLARQFLKNKPDYWRDFAFTMYKAESGIQKKYWKYVLGLFDEKPEKNNTI